MDMLRAALIRLRDEPVLTAAMASAFLILLVQAGLPIGDGFANALTGLILATSAWLARRKVKPARKRK